MELGMQKTQQAVERLVIPTVRRGREEDHVALLGLRQTTQEFMALMPPRAGGGAHMALIHNDKARACTERIQRAASHS